MATVIRRKSPFTVGLNYNIGGSRGNREDDLAAQRKEYNRQMVNILRGYQRDKDMLEKPAIYDDVRLPDIEKSKFRIKINRNKINLYGHPERGVEMILPEKKTVKREIEVFKAGEGNRPRKKISSDHKKALDEKYRTMAEVAGSAFDKRIRVDTDKLFGDEEEKATVRRSGTKKYWVHPTKGYIEGYENLQKRLRRHPEEIGEWESERLIESQARIAAKITGKPWAYPENVVRPAQQQLRERFEGDETKTVGRAFGVNIMQPKQKKEKGWTVLPPSEYEALARKYYLRALEVELGVPREKATDKQKEKAKAIARYRFRKEKIRAK